MPSKSKKQNRFMHAVARGDVPGVKKSVGKEFVAADHGRKISKLPEKVTHKHHPGKNLGKFLHPAKKKK